MFKILQNPASVKDLTAAYTQAMTFEKALSTERKEIHQKMMELQVDSFDRKPSKEIISVKTEMDALIIRLDACRFGREQIKNRLGERLQVESQERLEVIGKELDAVAAEEKKLKGQYLDACALAGAIREKLRGMETSYNGSVMVRLTPDPKFNFQLLSGEEQVYYSTKVEEIRQNSVGSFSETIVGRRSSLVEEQGKIERLLESDPLGNAEALLGRLIPSKPEPDEPEARKTTTFIKDYDKIGGPDYGEGESLPYRGVSEIVAEREMKQ